ncbi:hypothetical protein [Ciceribacter sp. RN22]|uniref:hypothetical protein n=1 Tax=Ciceribacter sp. RN22 TaxID=2954932 RepID=UPI002092A23A|nr:hypothetical protein [Ciceribacter sp. RN22]MCO6180886.1 hypothetical protein [Ciceribacter sp. RN22]MCO6181131.1 hypothetical protein [Ciceribacter sp. RN22]
MSDDQDDKFDFRVEHRSSRWICRPFNFLILVAPLVGTVLLIVLSLEDRSSATGPVPFLDDVVTSSIRKAN